MPPSEIKGKFYAVSPCDGSRPSCTLCTELGIRCVYEETSRNAQTSARTPHEYDERLRVIETILRQLVEQRDASSVPASDTPRGSDATAQLPANPWRALPNHGEIKVGSVMDDTVDGVGAVSHGDLGCRFFGPSSNVSFLRGISQTTSSVLKKYTSLWRSDPNGTRQTTPRLQSPGPRSASWARVMNPDPLNPMVLPPEHQAVHLIRLFFNDTGSLFPYISKEQLLSAYHSAKTRQFSGISRSLLCLLNAIFALATYISARPDQSASTCAAEAEVFFGRAQALSAHGNCLSNDTERVQCLLLLTKYCQGTQRPEEAWTLHGLAVSAAIQIGLHSPLMADTVHGREREVRKRLWFGCFVMDRMLSTTLGRPPIIQDDYMNLDLPSDTSLDAAEGRSGDADEDGQPNTAAFFIATIQLYKILGSIVAKCYSNNLGREAVNHEFVPMQDIFLIEERLYSWKRCLPEKLLLRPWEHEEHIALSGPGYHPVFARLSVILQLQYLNVCILLHRPVLDHLLRRKQPCPGSNPPEYREGFAEEVYKSSVTVCQDSAVQIIDIVHRLSRSTSLLGAPWFSTYYTFNAALIIFACILKRASSAPSRFKDRTDSQRSSSEAAGSLRLAMEAIERIGKDADPVMRILAILAKLVRICIMLGFSSSEGGFATGLPTSSAGEGHDDYNAIPSRVAAPSGRSIEFLGTGPGPLPVQPVLPSPATSGDIFGSLGDSSQGWSLEDILALEGLNGIYPDIVGLMPG